MKRPLRVAGIALAVLLLAASSALWNVAFRAPPLNRLPLPAELIALDSTRGQDFLAEATFTADYAGLARSLESQSRAAYCGVASGVTVLNTLQPEPRVTQTSFFTDEASKVRSSLQVTFAGMTLGQLAGLLRAHHLQVNEVYAADTTVEAFRAVAEQNLATAGDLMLVNYQRAALGQKEGGHISPIAAYDATTDRLLILDVATYKYPPVWVTTADLWKALTEVDTSSGRSRGFVVVKPARH